MRASLDDKNSFSRNGSLCSQRVRTPWLIASIYVADGAIAAIVIVSAPFLIAGPEDIPYSLASKSVGIGLFVGAIGLLFVGYISDNYAPLRFLQFVQCFEAALLLVTIFAISSNNSILSVLGIIFALAMCRTTGVIKDKLVSLYIPRENRLNFTSSVRQAFMVSNQVAIAMAVAALIILDPTMRAIILLLPLVLTLLSYILAKRLASRPMASVTKERLARHSTHFINIAWLRHNVLVIATIGLLSVTAIGATIATVGIPTWISLTNSDEITPAFVVVFSLLETVVSVLYTRYISARIEGNIAYWKNAISHATVLLSVSLLSIWATATVDSRPLALLFLTIAIVAGVMACTVGIVLSISTVALYGGDDDRGKISAASRLISNISVAVAAMLVPSLFLGSVLLTVLTILVGVVLLLIAMRVNVKELWSQP